MVSYRADVLRFLDIDPLTGKLQANGSHPVQLPDSGSTGNAVPSDRRRHAAAAVSGPGPMPLRSIVIYNGGETIDRGSLASR